MSVCYTSANREPQSRTPRLSREEWFKNTCKQWLRNTWARVRDFKGYPGMLLAVTSSYTNAKLPVTTNRFDRIEDQIQQKLLELRIVDSDVQRRIGAIIDNANVRLLKLGS